MFSQLFPVIILYETLENNSTRFFGSQRTRLREPITKSENYTGSPVVYSSATFSLDEIPVNTGIPTLKTYYFGRAIQNGKLKRRDGSRAYAWITFDGRDYFTRVADLSPWCTYYRHTRDTELVLKLLSGCLELERPSHCAFTRVR